MTWFAARRERASAEPDEAPVRGTTLPRDFLESEGEVTPSQKLKRKVIEQRFREGLDAMYREPVAQGGASGARGASAVSGA